MIEGMLRARLADYAPANSLEQESAIQEILQHFVLVSLARTGFFEEAMFHGGTCLRILHGLNRFSEDLDFLLKHPDAGFRWTSYLDRIRKDWFADGIDFEIVDRHQDAAVKKAFLKTDSIGNVILLDLPFIRNREKKVRIKLEIDSNPPEGSTFETAYLTFPLTAAITTQSLASGFATKSHALLCRGYAKGRDWYDFIWYVAKKVLPDLDLLGNALDQIGPWAGKGVRVTPRWYVEHMRARIDDLDWKAAKTDVRRFLPAREQPGVDLWDATFFRYHLERLERMLGS